MGVPSLPDQYPNNLPSYLDTFIENTEKDFILQLLNLSMIKRMNAPKALEHEWFNTTSFSLISDFEENDL